MTLKSKIAAFVGAAALAAGGGVTYLQSGYDFTFSMMGPTHVVKGHDLYIKMMSTLIEGPAENVFYSVTGLPMGATDSYPDLDTFCCGGNRAPGPGDTALKIIVNPITTPGTYPITVNADSGDVHKEYAWTIVIEDPPAPLTKTETPAQAIPSLAGWEMNMTMFGQKHCDNLPMLVGGSRIDATYYDAERVFYNIGEYTKDSKWYACATEAEKAYRDEYLIPNNGGLPGYFLFPHGLRLDFERTSDEISKQSVIDLATNGMFARYGTPISYGISATASRELSYSVMSYIDAEKLGHPRNPQMAIYVDVLIGHVDQWFVSKNFRCYYPTNCDVPPANGKYYVQPFMVGLVAEALTQYYDEINKDVRIPATLKLCADWLLAHAWNPPMNQAMWYENYIEDPNDIPAGYWPPAAGDGPGSPDLNLIIAPLYGWLYRETGDVKYRDGGDGLFAGGVAGAWLDGPKQFNQNYRWSFDYVKWRGVGGTEPPDPPDPEPEPPGDTTLPIVSIKATVDSKNNVKATATASDNVGVTKVEFYLDNKLKSTDATAPYTTSFKLTGPSSQRHVIAARAYDAAGNNGASGDLVLKK